MNYIPLLNMEVIKKAFEITPHEMHAALTIEIKDQLNRANIRDLKPNFWVSKTTGNKFPYFNQKYNIHKGKERFSPLGNGGQYWNDEQISDLPKNEYPYTIEYQIF